MKLEAFLLVFLLLPLASAMSFDNELLIATHQPLAVIDAGTLGYAGDTFQHTFTLMNTGNVPYPDAAYSDGSASYLYTAFRLIDTSGNTIAENYVQVTNTVLPGATIGYAVNIPVNSTMPPGKYAMTALLFYVPMTWNRATNTWTQNTITILDKQVVEYQLGAQTFPTQPSDLLAIIRQLFSSIVIWLKSKLSFSFSAVSSCANLPYSTCIAADNCKWSSSSQQYGGCTDKASTICSGYSFSSCSFFTSCSWSGDMTFGACAERTSSYTTTTIATTTTRTSTTTIPTTTVTTPTSSTSTTTLGIISQPPIFNPLSFLSQLFNSVIDWIRSTLGW
jgi:hypothetical protein